MLEHGRAKLARKGCDLLVVNAVGPGKAFGTSDNAAVILGADGSEVDVPLGPKALLAAAVCDAVVVPASRADDAVLYRLSPPEPSTHRSMREPPPFHVRVRHRRTPGQDRRPDQ